MWKTDLNVYLQCRGRNVGLAKGSTSTITNEKLKTKQLYHDDVGCGKMTKNFQP